MKIISNFYSNQKASIHTQVVDSDEIKIKCVVTQGCVLSPILYNVYSERIFKNALEDIDVGIKLNGEYINNIRYVEDTVVLEELREKLIRIHKTRNTKTTKYLIISKIQIQTEVPMVNVQ